MTRLRRACTALTLALALSAVPAEGKPRKKGRSREPAPPAMSAEEQDLSTAVRFEQVRNGGVLWGVVRPGPVGAAALVVRAGARNEDLNQSGVSLAVARWVLEPTVTDYLARQGVVVELEMLPGGAAFFLRGPVEKLPAATAALLKAANKPKAEHLARARTRAVLEPRRHDAVRSLPDAVSAVCWTGSSFELPTWGADDTLGMVDDAAMRAFHTTWYRPRNMTLIVAGPDGADAYARILSSVSKGAMSRDTLAPGQPGLPVHQVQRGQVPITAAGVAMPGPEDAGGALMLRTRVAELLEEEAEKGALAGPWVADIVWTASNAVVFAAMHHPDATNEQSLTEEQGRTLKILEQAIQKAAEIDDSEITALRKREGARLARHFASPHGAVRFLAPLATVTDKPIDVRKEVLATPTANMKKLLESARNENARFSIRRLPQTGT